MLFEICDLLQILYTLDCAIYRYIKNAYAKSQVIKL